MVYFFEFASFQAKAGKWGEFAPQRRLFGLILGTYGMNLGKTGGKTKYYPAVSATVSLIKDSNRAAVLERNTYSSSNLRKRLNLERAARNSKVMGS